MVTLYRAPFSTNVERVALALAHKGLDVRSVVISYDDRSEVERVSGQGLVPVIEEGGVVVSDSLAILRHLERAHPDPPLFPSGPPARAATDVFLEWFDAVWKVAPNAIEADPARTAELVPVMERHLDRFEQMLDGRDHLLGDDFSAADCAAFPFLKYARGRPEGDDDDPFHFVLDEHQSTEGRPRLAEWIERVDARPRA
jgi:glutathione S-transferase